jgi:hypothetical protein
VAFFADLRNLMQGLTDDKLRTNRQGRKVYPLGSDIFGEIAGCDIKPFILHFFYTFQSKKANLSMPISSMGIANYPMVFTDQNFDYGFFSLTLLLTNTNSDNFTRHTISSPEFLVCYPPTFDMENG